MGMMNLEDLKEVSMYDNELGMDDREKAIDGKELAMDEKVAIPGWAMFRGQRKIRANKLRVEA